MTEIQNKHGKDFDSFHNEAMMGLLVIRSIRTIDGGQTIFTLVV